MYYNYTFFFITLHIMITVIYIKLIPDHSLPPPQSPICQSLPSWQQVSLLQFSLCDYDSALVLRKSSAVAAAAAALTAC